MKTATSQLRTLKSRLVGLAGDAEVNLPAAFVLTLIEDLAALDDRLETALTLSVPHVGGEEWVG